jgi:hypothetical protein
MTNPTYGDLYDEMVTEPAREISQMLEFGDAARAAIDARGVDPDDMLVGIRESAYEDIKESLRPVFYARCEELGIKQ